MPVIFLYFWKDLCRQFSSNLSVIYRIHRKLRFQLHLGFTTPGGKDQSLHLWPGVDPKGPPQRGTHQWEASSRALPEGTLGPLSVSEGTPSNGPLKVSEGPIHRNTPPGGPIQLTCKRTLSKGTQAKGPYNSTKSVMTAFPPLGCYLYSF